MLKGFAEHPLFDGMRGGNHFVGGVDAHSHIQKFFVEEGHASLHAPCAEALIGAKAVVEVQSRKFAHRFAVKFFCRRRFVEIEVTAENFVGSFSRQHHFYAHRLNHACQQIHRRGGAHGGHVVGFDMVNHVA